MDWKIYYGDRSTFSSEQGDPEDAPAYNVQVIIQKDNEKGCGNIGTLHLRLHDWYYYRISENMWYGGDLHGILDLILSREPIIAICQGRMLPKCDYKEIEKAAMNDSDFPAKSAKKKFETP